MIGRDSVKGVGVGGQGGKFPNHTNLFVHFFAIWKMDEVDRKLEKKYIAMKLPGIEKRQN